LLQAICFCQSSMKPWSASISSCPLCVVKTHGLFQYQDRLSCRAISTHLHYFHREDRTALDGWIYPTYKTPMEQLKSDIAAFRSKHGMPVTTFGRLAIKDPRFIEQIENGRRVWPETEAKVRSFMASYAQNK